MEAEYPIILYHCVLNVTDEIACMQSLWRQRKGQQLLLVVSATVSQVIFFFFFNESVLKLEFELSLL